MRRQQGYVSDITRMLFLGDPSSECLKVHQIVEKAVTAPLRTAHRGVLAKDVDAAACGVIEKAVYGRKSLHQLGHGLGSKLGKQSYLITTLDAVLE